MSTYTQILYQIVFSTKYNQMTLNEHNLEKLYRFIGGIIKNKKCHLYQIGGISDHLHILTHLHPTMALAQLVKDIKLASTEYIKSGKIFTGFIGWQDGYGAFTYSFGSKDNLIEYVKNQKEHHKKKGFREEYIMLLKEHGIEFNEKYLL